jgi:selenocysteine lyase/cysteine desulfurase
MNTHGLAGLAAALEYLEMTGVDTIHARELSLMRRFYEGVRSIEGVKVYGDFTASERTPVVAVNLWDCDSGAISDALAEEYGIATRPGAHCAPRMHRALGTEEQGAVRFSFSYFNTEEEIDIAVKAIRRLAEESATQKE